jgi:hypothetical protein
MKLLLLFVLWMTAGFVLGWLWGKFCDAGKGK